MKRAGLGKSEVRSIVNATDGSFKLADVERRLRMLYDGRMTRTNANSDGRQQTQRRRDYVKAVTEDTDGSTDSSGSDSESDSGTSSDSDGSNGDDNIVMAQYEQSKRNYKDAKKARNDFKTTRDPRGERRQPRVRTAEDEERLRYRKSVQSCKICGEFNHWKDECPNKDRVPYLKAGNADGGKGIVQRRENTERASRRKHISHV